jgi:hypothetical protein
MITPLGTVMILGGVRVSARSPRQTRRFTSSQLSGAQKAYLRSLPVELQVEREGYAFIRRMRRPPIITTDVLRQIRMIG